MKNILYIGNQLKHRKGTVTTIDVLGPLLENEGYNIWYASSKSMKLFRLMDMMFAVLKNRKKVDYVLIDTYSTSNFYYALFVSQLCRFLRLKYIPVLHGGNLPHRLSQNPKLSNVIFNNAYQNVAPSNYIKSEFERFGYLNVMSIPNAIEIKQYPFTAKDYNSIKMLWVRSFSKIYNPKLAINILKSLHDEGFKSTLCMVGPEKDGSLADVKRHAETLDIDVRFTGKLSKKEWVALSKEYNIFINTTNFDNMPVSVIEAMALGFVIISTNVGGMPFLIKHNHDGLLVNPNDSQGFVSYIKEIRSNSDKAEQLSQQARQKAETFDWEQIKPHWVSLLE